MIRKQMNDEIYCFDSPGIATIIMHRNKAASLFKIVDTAENDKEKDIRALAGYIVSDMMAMPKLGESYPVLNPDEITESCSPTLQTLLSTILLADNKKAVALICCMINSIAFSKTSMLQVALGLLVQEKRLIQHLHEYGVTATYDEVRRYKISAAAANKTQTRLGSTKGLIQGISDDNFDAHLSTPNGLLNRRIP